MSDVISTPNTDTGTLRKCGGILSWSIRRARETVVCAICRHFYRDDRGEELRTVLVAGAARSGTTWLGDLIANPIPTRIMFEPFNPHRVEMFARFPEFVYMRPEDENEELEAYCRRVLSGRVRHPWIDSHVHCTRPRIRLIKEVRANLFLKWLTDRFPKVRPIMIFRHPCAVVQSRLETAWPAGADLEAMLSQTRLVGDFLQDKMPLIDCAKSPEEKLAAIWCINYLVPLHQFGTGELPAIFYEDLVMYPEGEIPKAFALAAVDCPPSVIRAAQRPSHTAKPFSPVVTGGDQICRWRTQLSPAQIERILSIVKGFGLEDIYDDSPTPLHSARRMLAPQAVG